MEYYIHWYVQTHTFTSFKMSKFNGLSRKFTLLSLPLFMVGWAFYVAGFISELNKHTTFIGASKTISILCPYYVILIGGPFIIKLELLHAVLPGVASSVCAAMLSMLSTAYFTSVGATSFTCTAIITKGTPDLDADDDNSRSDDKFGNIKLMLTGLLLQGFSWSLILAFSTLYNYEPDSSERIITDSSESQCTFTPRVAQNINLVCLILAGVGWCVLSVGLYHTSEWPDEDVKYLSNSSYTFQLHPLFVSITLILINLGTCLQLRSTKKSIMICISVLGLVYFFILGDKVNSVLMILHECSSYNYYCSHEYKNTVKLILSGGVICIFFWGCSSAVWPFHRRYLPSQNRAWWKRSRFL